MLAQRKHRTSFVSAELERDRGEVDERRCTLVLEASTLNSTSMRMGGWYGGRTETMKMSSRPVNRAIGGWVQLYARAMRDQICARLPELADEPLTSTRRRHTIPIDVHKNPTNPTCPSEIRVPVWYVDWRLRCIDWTDLNGALIGAAHTIPNGKEASLISILSSMVHVVFGCVHEDPSWNTRRFGYMMKRTHEHNTYKPSEESPWYWIPNLHKIFVYEPDVDHNGELFQCINVPQCFPTIG